MLEYPTYLDDGRLYFTVASLPMDTAVEPKRWHGITRSAGFFRRRLSGWVTPNCSNPNDLHPYRNEPYVVCFRVQRGFLDYLRQTAIPENLTRAFPDRPQLVDIAGGDDQYGFPLEHARDYLEETRVPSSTHCHPKESKGCNNTQNMREPSSLPSADEARIADFISGPCFDGLNRDDPVDIDLVIRADEKR